MKYATRYGKDVIYWGKPPVTQRKKNREPVLLGQRKCWFRFMAKVRKWVYEII
jgi:hypothetical protein